MSIDACARLMYLENLILQNFRNYGHLHLEFNPHLNIFIGENSQGKTNLLEAIYYLIITRSPRTFKDAELIRWGQQGFSLKGKFSGGQDLSVEIIYTPEEKKCKINFRPVAKFKINEEIKVLFFSVEDVDIFKGPPALRRRFLDEEISQIDKGYRHTIWRYQGIIRQRNFCLKEIREGGKGKESLAVWDKQLVENGTRIIKKRMEVIKELGPLLFAVYQPLGIGKEVRLEYWSSVSNNLPDSLEGLSRLFAQAISQKGDEEISFASSLIGPHRDDLKAFIDGRDACIYASQGQQRVMALGLKLAFIEIIKKKMQEPPLILLDDFLSELDEKRRNYLLNFLRSQAGQIFITSTEQRYFVGDLGQARLFQVFDNQVSGLETCGVRS